LDSEESNDLKTQNGSSERDTYESNSDDGKLSVNSASCEPSKESDLLPRSLKTLTSAGSHKVLKQVDAKDMRKESL